jgi:rubrerythrin/ferredoxin
MANITFSSPKLAKDVTVYAVAGDRGTILAVAKEHKIPIPFDCQDGECGSCLIEVKHVNPKNRCCVAMTEKEKEMLKQIGKITKAEIEDAEVNDMPPRYRLACQYFVRNEDIFVYFAGDETVPDAGPHITHAAARFKGGLDIKTIDEFLSYAVKVEQDAALHFDELAEKMETCCNGEVAKLFRQLAGFSRLHLGEAQKRASAIDAHLSVPPDYVWPTQVTPERTEIVAGDPALTRLDGLRAALLGERRGYDFYRAVEATTKNDEVKAMAKQFCKEESEHVHILEAWISREEWNVKHAPEPVA